MKKVLRFGIVGVIALLFVGCATTAEVWLNTFEENKVIKAPNKTKDELYVASNLWAVDAFGKSDSVIEFSDKEAGVIKGKYIHDFGINFWDSFWSSSKYYTANVDNEVRFVISITCRDGEVEVKINNPIIKAGSVKEDEARMACKQLIASLEKELLN
jgi:hypothetical protein